MIRIVRDLVSELAVWLLLAALTAGSVWWLKQVSRDADRDAEILRDAARPFVSPHHRRYVTGPPPEALVRAVGEQPAAEAIEPIHRP